MWPHLAAREAGKYRLYSGQCSVQLKVVLLGKMNTGDGASQALLKLILVVPHLKSSKFIPVPGLVFHLKISSLVMPVLWFVFPSTHMEFSTQSQLNDTA